MKWQMVIAAALLSTIAADGAGGQGAEEGGRRRERIAQEGAAPRRQQMEQRLRTGVARVVKQRLRLTDDQMSKLARANVAFDGRRRDLVREERATRVELRRLVLAGDGADQQRIATALDRLLELQRRRIDLQIEEQRELATFMSPMQRAKYVALREQIRRRAENIRSGRPAGGAARG